MIAVRMSPRKSRRDRHCKWSLWDYPNTRAGEKAGWLLPLSEKWAMRNPC